MKILVITSHFPPDQHVASHRWNRLGMAMVNAGHSVSIIVPGCPRKNGKSDRADTVSLSGINVHRVQWPLKARLKGKLQGTIRQLCYSKPLQVSRLLGIGECFIREKLQYWVTDLCYFFTFPHISWEWAVAASRDKVVNELAASADVVIGSHPYSGMLELARLLSKYHQKPWVADFRDPWHNDVQLKGNLTSRRLKKLEHDLLQEADLIVTINLFMARMLATERAEKEIAIIPNSFSALCSEQCARMSRSKCFIEIAYTGNILEYSKWQTFFQALEGLPDLESEDKKLEIDYYGASFSRIATYVNQSKAKGIHIVNNGIVTHAEASEACRMSDLLLLFGWNGEGKECVMTGKVFDYLVSGRPIIAVTERGTALSEMIEETGAGIVLENEKAVTSFLERLLADSGAVIHELESKINLEAIRRYSTTETSALYLARLEKYSLA